MKKLLPFVIVTLMVGLSPWVHAQWNRCLPGGMMNQRYRSAVPVPLVAPRPLVPAFQYPHGVGQTMTDMPLPTRNPSLDVDVSAQRSRQQSELMRPMPAATRNRQPIPMVYPESPIVVSGRFATLTKKDGAAKVTEETTSLQTLPAQEGNLPIVGPISAPEPPEIISVTPELPEIISVPVDPFDDILDEEVEQAAVKMSDSVDAPFDDSGTFDSEEDSDPFVL